MVSIIVNNIVTCSSDIEFKYLASEEVFGYDITANYEINVSDIALAVGDTVLLQGRDAISTAYKQQNIVARIGGDEFLHGRITSLSFPSGPLVGSEIASITIQESRRLDDYSSKTFSKYIPNPHLLDNFQEQYNFSRQGSNYSYSRQVSISYNQDAGEQFLWDAKAFLTNYYFENRPSYGYQQDGISEDAKFDKRYKGNLTETYNLLALSVSLTENFNSSFIDTVNDVSRKEVQQIGVDENGYLEKTLQFELTSLRLGQDTLHKAIKEIIDDAKSENESQFGNPFSIQKGIKKDGDTASLTISFSTDPKKSQENSVSYSGGESKNGVFTEYSLSVNYSSTGKSNKQKFDNSRLSWLSAQDDNENKITNLFHPNKNFYEKSRNTNFSKSEGTISEQISFTTDDSYKPNDDGILKYKTSVSKTHQIERNEVVLDLSDMNQKLVKNNLKTVGVAEVKATATANPSLGIFKAKDFLETKTSALKELIDEDIIHITTDSYSLSLSEGVASRSISFVYI